MSTRPRVLLTLSGYACEGGLDGRYQPATCYAPTIALGRHPGPGVGDGLWDNYERVVDLASELGLAGISLEVSWARLEPRPGQRDETALARYVEVVARARQRGLWVNVAAIDAAWPAWLGLEAWLLPWVEPVAVEHVRWLASSLEADTMSVFAARAALTRGFLFENAGPPWRRGARDDAASAEKSLDSIETLAHSNSAAEMVTSITLDLDDLVDAAEHDVDEVHVKSLVRGAGPLASVHALLGRRDGEWVVVDAEWARELGARP